MSQLSFIQKLIPSILLTAVYLPLNAAPLFDQNKISDFQIVAPFEQMTEAKKKFLFLDLKKQKFEGFIKYKNPDSTLVQIPVTLSFKGFSTLSCQLPKLELKLNQTQNTLFEGQKKIDLHTHCGDIKDNPSNTLIKSMYFAHREVTAYKILKILNLQFLHALPIKALYIDINNSKPAALAPLESYQAFFLEDKSEYKKRNQLKDIFALNDALKDADIQSGKTILAEYQYDHADAHKTQLNSFELAKLEFVQNLVGNMDWFIKSNAEDFRFNDNMNKVELWNIKIFENPQGQWIPLIQDFNFSSLAMYSKSDLTFPIEIKLFQRLNKSERQDLIQFLSAQQQAVLNSIEFLSKDSEFDLLKKSMNERYEQILKSLKSELLP